MPIMRTFYSPSDRQRRSFYSNLEYTSRRLCLIVNVAVHALLKLCNYIKGDGLQLSHCSL